MRVKLLCNTVLTSHVVCNLLLFLIRKLCIIAIPLYSHSFCLSTCISTNIFNASCQA